MPRKALSLQRKRFVDAYLTDANGNGTKAAIAAGYSPKTAGVQASQLLKQPGIRRLLGERLARQTITADKALENISAIADAHVVDPSPKEILAANKLILEANGRLRDKHADSRITVNLGFMVIQQPAAVSASDMQPNMPLLPHVTISKGILDAD